MDKVQKYNSFNTNTPSSESYGYVPSLPSSSFHIVNTYTFFFLQQERIEPCVRASGFKYKSNVSNVLIVKHRNCFPLRPG
jgi:hypothetical protein